MLFKRDNAVEHVSEYAAEAKDVSPAKVIPVAEKHRGNMIR